MEDLPWLQKWYVSQCDGDWEHTYGIQIANIDNPGWSLKVFLEGTDLEGKTLEYSIIENSEEDWIAEKSDGVKYESYGDPEKLAHMIKRFRRFVDA